jgi:hypothetical protein
MAQPVDKRDTSGEPAQTRAEPAHTSAEPARLTVTMAPGAETRHWPTSARREATWEEAKAALLDPRGVAAGTPKDGLCFVPGWLAGATRRKTTVAGISMLVGDIDCGIDAGEIVTALRASGYAWALASTHGHMRQSILKPFPLAVWGRMLAYFKTAEAVAACWLRANYIAAIAEGGADAVAVVEGEKAVELHIHLRRAVPHWRLMLPLDGGWAPSSGPGVGAAELWARSYLQAFGGLGLGMVDPACADASRLYYTGRQPARAGEAFAPGCTVKAEFYESKPGLPWAKLERLLEAGRVVPKTTGSDAKGAARAELERATGESGRLGAGRRVGGGNRPARIIYPWLVARDGGEVDLEQWHHDNGHALMLAGLVAAHEGGALLDGRADSDDGHVHFICPRAALHASGAPGGTFAWDGSGWLPPAMAGRRRGGMHCNHAGCAGMTPGRWLGALLTSGVVSWADLDAAAERVAARRIAAMQNEFGAGADGEEKAPPPVGGASRVEPRDTGGDRGAAPAPAAPAAPRGAVAGGTSGVAGRGIGSHPATPIGEGRILTALKMARETASDEEEAAQAERQFQATERFVVLTSGAGQFFDLRAAGSTAAIPLNKGVMLALLVSQYGFPAWPRTLTAWMRWDAIRVKAGLPGCVCPGVSYQPGAGIKVFDVVKGWTVNIWRPGPPAWPQAVADDDPAIVDLVALATAITGDTRECCGLLWWAADMLVRAGEERATWGPLNFGPQGCGKSAWLRCMAAMVGDHNAAIIPFRDFVRGSENTALLKQLTGIEEADAVVRRGHEKGADFYNMFKPLYTADHIWLQQKYITGQDVKLNNRIAVNANDAHAFALPPEDRRIWPMQARGGRLERGLAERIHARMKNAADIGKWIRWLCDGYAGWGAVYGFSPFRCPTEDVASATKAEVIEATLTQAGTVALEVGRRFEAEGRTVLLFDEVSRAVGARLRLDPGERPAEIRVRDGLVVAGWIFVKRGVAGGRNGLRGRFWARGKEVAGRGLAFFNMTRITERLIAEGLIENTSDEPGHDGP